MPMDTQEFHSLKNIYYKKKKLLYSLIYNTFYEKN